MVAQALVEVELMLKPFWRRRFAEELAEARLAVVVVALAMVEA
jgi:hypothetical protein